MNQSNKIVAATILFSLAFITPSFSQGAFAMNKTTSSKTSLSSGESRNYRITAEKSFALEFPNAAEVKWKIDQKNSFVFFINEGRIAQACFNKKGVRNYLITHCTLQNLPREFVHTINTVYAAYQLFYAFEIKAHGKTAYEAIIENDRNFITLKYTIDGVEEIRRIKKQ